MSDITALYADPTAVDNWEDGIGDLNDENVDSILLNTSTTQSSAPLLTPITMKDMLIAQHKDDFCIKYRSRIE